MKTFGTVLLAFLLVIPMGCGSGEVTIQGQEAPEKNSPLDCPPPGTWKCYGDMETGTGVWCVCEGLWDCSKDPNKCSGKKTVPPGGGDWKCTYVSEYDYSCVKSGDKTKQPDAGNGWFCFWDDAAKGWRCRKITAPVPTGGGTWNCVTDKEGTITCTKKDQNGGLPTGGGGWTCHQTTLDGKLTWVCTGKTNKGASPPGGNGWQCKKTRTEGGYDWWHCTKLDGKTDYPDPTKNPPGGGGYYACVKGSEFNGTKCVKVDKPPQPLPPNPTKGSKCDPGTKRWCDGLQYCGWGQVTCKPDGTWPMRTLNGQQVLDCQELKSGHRPKTMCACYHFFYNPACCERPDCVVPPGTNGQICPASAGKLCDYCNPLKPKCVNTGAICVVTNTHETFCGKQCANAGDCPAKGYKCTPVKIKIGTTKQCIPSDYSCYY